MTAFWYPLLHTLIVRYFVDYLSEEPRCFLSVSFTPVRTRSCCELFFHFDVIQEVISTFFCLLVPALVYLPPAQPAQARCEQHVGLFELAWIQCGITAGSLESWPELSAIRAD